MSQPSQEVLILGIGNYLMGDEGVGVHLARRLENSRLPLNVKVLDGGTGGFHLMNYFEEHSVVIMIDATLDGGAPGAIRLIRPRFSSDFPKAMSTHDIGLKDVVESLLLLGKLPTIHLFTVSIREVQPMQVTLSPEVEAALPELEERIRGLLVG
jgi:hydrogenase maturation protease